MSSDEKHSWQKYIWRLTKENALPIAGISSRVIGVSIGGANHMEYDVYCVFIKWLF